MGRSNGPQSAYKRFDVEPKKAAEVHTGDDPVRTVAYKWPILEGVPCGVYEPSPGVFPPMNRSEWALWGELEDPEGLTYDEGNAVSTFRNSSNRRLAPNISNIEGPHYSFREYGMNGLPSITKQDTYNYTYGYRADNGVYGLYNYNTVVHLMAVLEIPPVITGSVSIPIFKTGNLGSFNGYNTFQLFSNRMESHFVTYGFFPSFGISYIIPFSSAFPTGVPVILHLEANTITNQIILRVNGKIIGGVGIGEGTGWTQTAGSVSEGLVNVLFFPYSYEMVKFSVLGAGSEREGELTPEIVEGTTLYLSEKYRIPVEEYELP